MRWKEWWRSSTAHLCSLHICLLCHTVNEDNITALNVQCLCGQYWSAGHVWRALTLAVFFLFTSEFPLFFHGLNFYPLVTEQELLEMITNFLHQCLARTWFWKCPRSLLISPKTHLVTPHKVGHWVNPWHYHSTENDLHILRFRAQGSESHGCSHQWLKSWWSQISPIEEQKILQRIISSKAYFVVCLLFRLYWLVKVIQNRWFKFSYFILFYHSFSFMHSLLKTRIMHASL